MRHLGVAFFSGLLLTVACGGAGTNNSAGVPFAGTLSIAAGAAGTTCVNRFSVTFTAAGADKHVLALAAGDCVDFDNQDTAHHQPASYGTTVCAELNGPSLATGGSYETPPMGGPRTCQWQDALNPLPPPGSGGGY